MKTMWKVFKADLKSNNGNIKWEIGEWQKHEGELRLCASGFHASERIVDAMYYTSIELLARVEVKGDHLVVEDKQCWSEMRILEVFPWTKEDSVSLVIFAAEQVIGIFERFYPDNARPRKDIELAKNWLKENTKASAGATAEVAAGAVWSAARAMSSVVGDSKNEEILERCEKFILSRLQNRRYEKD